ncbi:MAG: response regulator [Pseudomonadota bacterium]
MLVNGTILIVDDDRRMCNSLKALLCTQGYTIKSDDNGKDALKHLAEEMVDLVLLDIVMEKMSGFQVMDRMADQHLDVPVIIITGHASTASAVEALRRGAYDYLRKPFEPEELFASVKNALAQRRLQQDKYRMKRNLQDSEEHFRTLFNQASDCIFIVDPTPEAGPVIVDVNDAACSAYGYTVKEFLGKPFSSIDAQDAGKCGSERVPRLMSGEQFIYESEHIRKDGTLFPVEVSARLTHIGSRPIIYAIERNITERKRAEEALRKSEEWLKSVFRVAPIGIGVAKNRILQDVNPRLCEMTGYTQAELIGTSARVLYPTREEFEYVGREKYRQISKTGAGEVETRFRTKDGSVIDVLLASTPMNSLKFSAGMTFTALDITERKRAAVEKEKLQTELFQAQKMEAIGRLAGGVAHDFNNMLSIILGRAELARMKIKSSDLLYKDLCDIEAVGKRSANLTRQLLGFARKQAITPKILNLNNTIASLLKMLRRLIGEDVGLLWKPAADLWPVKMDPAQIDQILANLVINARDAIKDVGKVIIETGNVVLDEAYCAVHKGFVPGEFTLLAVSDDGCGIDRKTLPNIFEPFFTTKDIGKGTGLGLATVYGITKQNHGFINAYSELGRGSTFKIYLPRYGGGSAGGTAEAPVGSVTGGSETILLVEDEPEILGVVTTMLESLGYAVLSVESPDEAIRLTREHSGEIHLVITDVVMPEMNGRDLSDRLLSLYPNLKCLFMSGYTANVIAHHGVLDEGVRFIQKPFSMRDLAATIRQILAQE